MSSYRSSYGEKVGLFTFFGALFTMFAFLSGMYYRLPPGDQARQMNLLTRQTNTEAFCFVIPRLDRGIQVFP
ncbi:MAG: hypothetical protein ACYC69_02250 [Thermodesulfovibrionales bacterium]